MAEISRMKSASGQGASFKKFDDIVFPNVDLLDPERGVSYAKDFVYKDGDIILCSYPKSGTHWIGNIIDKLRTFDSSKRKTRDSLLEFGPPEVFDLQESPRIIPTHLKPGRLYLEQAANKAKVVFILRNPKDIIVSDYYHLKNAILFQNKQTWDEFFQSFIIGEVHHGSFFTYVKEWESLLQVIANGKSNVKVELFYFEDLLLNPKESLDRLNSYLGFNRDEECLNRILKETTLQSLRGLYSSQELVNPLSTDAKGNSIIFRKGQVGDWKTHLTVTQSELIDRLVNDTLAMDIVKFRYET